MDMEWKSVGLTGIYVVMRCSAPVDTIAILHSNLRATDTVRIRAGAVHTNGEIVSPVYDSGLVPAYEGLKFDPYTTKTIVDLGAPVQSLFWRFDFVSPGNPDGQVKAARIVMGERVEVSGINFGWEKLMLNDSQIVTGPNYEDVDEYPSRPGVKAKLGRMDEDAFNRFDAFMMQVGSAKPVLFAPEPYNPDTVQHWTVYGRMKAWKFQNPYHDWWDIEPEVHGLRA
ncbi:hypothetical protein AX777_05875 [Sphingobium yanoikuyae]|uniref:Uncharacterized protein n=2 Tax=Sphingobium yanoikuyae TaxID=13690 RepID=A0A177JR63_SPHYA|nr:hypothetical protein AX777_05875 [Sphingobium yanoikuyae]